jgi:hypothetical protein
MPAMTKLQRKYIEDIEKNLDVVFDYPNTRKGADLFIKKYKDENTRYKLENKKQFPPSGKQKRLIEDIEKSLDIKFKGRTVKTAAKFIKDNIIEFKAVQTTDQKIKNYYNKLSDNIRKQQNE